MFAVDDELETSAKHEALDELPPERRSRAWEAWVRLGAACRKRGTGGLVTASLLTKILFSWKPSERERAALDLVEARGGRACGLWVRDGDAFRFHAWEEWQPDEEEAAEEREHISAKTLRQRRWRHQKKVRPSTQASTVDAPVDAPVDGEASTRASTKPSTETPTQASTSPSTSASTKRLHVDADNVSRAHDAHARAARDPVPSLPVPSHPSQDHRDRVASLWRVGYCRRYESALSIAPSPPAGGDLVSLIDRALAQKAPDAYVTAALDGFFGDAWAREHRYPIGNLAKHTDRYAAAQATPPKARAKPRTEDPDKYRPSREWEPDAVREPVPLADAARGLLASLGLKEPS